jgi:phytoene dehydrogenase-like protein
MGTQRVETLIIGAGMSGLAAGIRLAQFAVEPGAVVILERHRLPGGLNSYYKRHGQRLDTGLHALTNFAERGTRGAPLTRMLRQLRIGWDELRLVPQGHSQICFPGLTLRFSNDFALLESEVARAFPGQLDAFRALATRIAELPLEPVVAADPGARAVLAEYFTEPLLIEALMLPCCYYGSARVGDMDWGSFAILFRSLFLEGLALPEGGIKPLLDLLVQRFKGAGGQLRLGCGVASIIVEGGRARGVVLDNGDTLHCERILSSAGLVETAQLAGLAGGVPAAAGELAFTETLLVLDRPAHALGLDAAVTFYNLDDRFDWSPPVESVGTRSGVICSPDNYAWPQDSAENRSDRGLVRATALANHRIWSALAGEQYTAEKERCADLVFDAASTFVPDPRACELWRDSFTPNTITRYTGHAHGAIYGSPDKRPDGRTGVDGLYLCGTDQGLLGIVGSLLSGITMANTHVLAAPTAP